MQRDDAAYWDEVEEAAELLQEGRFAEALTNLRDIIRVHPDNPYAFHHAGVGMFETAQYEAARDAFRAAVRLAPDFLGARVALSHALRQAGDARGALDQAEQALRRFPKDPDAMHAAGLAQASLGQRKKAKANLQGFLEGSPEFEAATEVRQILEMLGLGDEGEPLEIE
jgi:predicted Zn-dependent protease